MIRCQWRVLTIGQVHVPSGDVEEDGIRWSDEGYSNNWSSWHTPWRTTKRVDRMIRLEVLIIDQVQVVPSGGWRVWDRMIRWEVIVKQLQVTRFTYILQTDEGARIVLSCGRSHQIQIISLRESAYWEETLNSMGDYLFSINLSVDPTTYTIIYYHAKKARHRLVPRMTKTNLGSRR